MKIDYFAFSDAGLKRNMNQDSYLVENDQETKPRLFVVADGMGGHSHGERASRTIVASLRKWIAETAFLDSLSPADLAEAMKQVLLRANKMIRDGSKDGEVCGSTVVILCIWKEAYVVISVGDSRIYRYGKKGFSQITRDDVWELQQKVLKAYSQQEIDRHPNKGKLVSAVGVNADLTVTCNIDVLEKRNNFLLCSDGVYKYSEESDLKKCVTFNSFDSGDERIRRLKQKVFDRGAGDNATAILVICKS